MRKELSRKEHYKKKTEIKLEISHQNVVSK